MLDIIVACFRGLGVSPVSSALITADGLMESKRGLNATFDLEEVQSEEFGIEHDCSYSRKDRSQGDLRVLDPAAWNVTLNSLRKCGKMTPKCLGLAKLARIAAERKRNPRTKYDDEAAAYGALEVGMLLGTYNPAQKGTDLAFYCIRHLFQNERIPYRCRPTEVTAKFDTVLDFATALLKENEALQHTSGGLVSTREVRL
ncbi:hypothetical protein HRG_011390 [Hirsutella rhossiliensis]|uniref:Heme haloperoxidase family profile domain-containing protein n=1 Tax=Hirsutella rhossiliensis TaxID=111463 RepID=A0A9P8MLR5_9HYPO|nr:uncharacterized protein HRG_11390 [Hirsutella rhossiliensis]KAH0957608.1 hypothetical protein HRG_11390 [Hirsutella rhossiliensis]